MSVTNDPTFLKYKKQIEALKQLYTVLYPKNVESHFGSLQETIYSAFSQRKKSLKQLDLAATAWHMQQDLVGMTLYLDLFTVDLPGFKKKIPYLQELGINFIHFMPLLMTRTGDNDGGYAVKDYKSTQEKYGMMDDFIALLDILNKKGIYTCIDFVINHTAKEHIWAQKALCGDTEYQSYYMMYATDEIPRAFNQTVPEVFPGVSPGNFTYYEEMKKWVFTSFYEYQWDLNFKNPAVFEKIVDIMLFFSNIGVNMIRLDAIPFMWKTLGTSCRNLPEIHPLLQMLSIICEIVCPSTRLLGEAIVAPEEIVKYFGTDQPECHVMYNANYMVNIWNALATRDVRLLIIDSKRFSLPDWACWINYIRCHDDIGWGFNEKAISDMGYSPFDHKQFLIRFYEGTHEGSFSKGQLYEYDETTKDARNCGTLASLCGLEKAQDEQDVYQGELALKRIGLIDSLLMASVGIPLIYSGDEIATINDYTYLEDSHKKHDSRWLHRPNFNWEAAKKRNDQTTPAGLIFQKLKKLIHIRKTNTIFCSNVQAKPLTLNSNAVYCFVKRDNGKVLLCLFNFSEDRQFIQTNTFRPYLIEHELVDLISGRKVNFEMDTFQIGPYEHFWFYSDISK